MMALGYMWELGRCTQVFSNVIVNSVFLKHRGCLWNFKEYWCKRLHHKNVCEKVYRQPRTYDSLKKGKLNKQDFAVTKHKTTLLLLLIQLARKSNIIFRASSPIRVR